MGFSLGIVGLPNVGKSTLFNCLSRARAEVSNYPFCTIKPNIGVVEVPDERLAEVQRIVGSAKAIPTVLEFIDIAGLVKGAHQGEGLGNQFLGQIRAVDAIAHVVRCFRDPEIAHVAGAVDPRRDVEIINAELNLADLALVEKRLIEVRNKAKGGDKALLKQAETLERIKETLATGQPARSVKPAENELPAIAELPLLTLKPVLFVANVDETGNADEVARLQRVAVEHGGQTVALCAKLEAELAELPPEDASAYLREVGLAESGLQRLIRAGYELLGLLTFFTANEKEARAWTVARGTPAPAAAGQVHSDLENGFIAAEVVRFADLKTSGSYPRAREKGLVHTEGKSYLVQDGDLLLVRFSR